jgi:tungstate transport system substrate-binding protein
MLLRHSVGLARIVGLLAILASSVFGTAAIAGEHRDDDVVRLAVVNTPQFSGLLDNLLPEFERKTGLRVDIYSGNDVFRKARAGQADLVISHYGKKGVERFVTDGYGAWPRIVFANQAVLIGHRSDPAGVRGLRSLADALTRIADAKAPFIHNDIPGVSYLTEIALEAAGRPARTDWFVDTGRAKAAAILLAEERKGYVIWGAFPFLLFDRERDLSELEILVAGDPLLQRIMSAIVVNPDKLPDVNVDGARALLDYLLSPQVQARIAAFRTPGSDLQLWWPAGRNN